MTQRGSRFLAIALGLSLTLHIATYIYFVFGRAAQHSGHKGVVSVDFIQPISHPSVHKESVAVRPLKHGEALKPAPPQSNAVEAPQPEPAQPAGDPAAVASEASAFINSVARLLNQNKVYPKLSIDRGEEGRVMIGLTMDRDGKVLDTKIEESSPFSRLNEAALQTVKNVAHFPPIPGVVPAPIHLHVPIVFQIENN